MKTLAKFSGIAYLLIFISGFYANFAILSSLIDIGSSAKTTINIISNSIQFRNGLFGFLAMLVADIFLIWSLLEFTKPANKRVAYVASLFRGFHALFFIIALFRLIEIYHITYKATNSIELQATVVSLLSEFDMFWTIGLLFFGAHLVTLSFLCLKFKSIPKLISLLLVIAALGYFVDGLAKLYFQDYLDYQFYFEVVVILTAVIGELSFTIWLLILGFSRQNEKV